MNKGVKFTGVPSMEEIKGCPGTPGEERFEKGPVVSIECVQKIPCNPCEAACPFGAIEVGSSITSLPKLDEEKCIGCGVCIPKCPGLAIFKIHKNYSEKTSMVEFPFEYLPLPEKGDQVPCGDRFGKYIADGKVLDVKNDKKNDGTTLISVEIPKEYFMGIRTIYRG
ncbi:4Fe-4S binding protein [Fusobacteria bacterium ZRK30]|nr:4Fe-4S binding protein [Fusobacteria bacterium ZRK30]